MDCHLVPKAMFGCGEAGNACRQPFAKVKEVLYELFSQVFTFRQKFVVKNLRSHPDRE
jgi:hypothetical protein